jgi:hypothetical protein
LLVELDSRVRNEVEARPTGLPHREIEQGTADAKPSMRRRNRKERWVRLDLPVTLDVRKSDHLTAFEGHDRRDARCGKYAMGAVWVCRKRWPVLGFAETQHATKVGPRISTSLHSGSLDSLSDVRISAARSRVVP